MLAILKFLKTLRRTNNHTGTFIIADGNDIKMKSMNARRTSRWQMCVLVRSCVCACVSRIVKLNT